MKIGLLQLLGVLFVGLKLTGNIDWSWWYVTMPFWMPFIILVIFFLLGASIKKKPKSLAEKLNLYANKISKR